MSIEAVSANNQRHGSIVPMMQGAVVGAASGLVLKYGKSVTKDEMNTPEYKKVVSDIYKTKEVYSSWTDSYLKQFRKKTQMTVAEDEFVKMFDGLKDGDKIGFSRKKSAINNVLKRQPNELGELKLLFENSKKEADKIAKMYVRVYNLATKHIRPTGFFLTTGAIVGATVALAHEILRTNVKS